MAQSRVIWKNVPDELTIMSYQRLGLTYWDEEVVQCEIQWLTYGGRRLINQLKYREVSLDQDPWT